MLSHIDGLLDETRYVYDDQLISGPILTILLPVLDKEWGVVFEQGLLVIVKVRAKPAGDILT